MANTSSSKGNPASHRMGNVRLKSRRAESWARGEKRKDANRKKNEALHKEKVANGGLGKRELRRIASGVRKEV